MPGGVQVAEVDGDQRAFGLPQRRPGLGRQRAQAVGPPVIGAAPYGWGQPGLLVGPGGHLEAPIPAAMARS